MASSHNDPKLLYSVEGIKAYHIANGVEQSLTPSGPQTLSLLMVPTSSGFADPTGVGNGEQDFYLHLHLPPELDLPLPATTQIYHQPPSSYLIPRWDLGPGNGAFTRLEFPVVGSRPGVQEDVDTFETILAQCTAFLERAPAPPPEKRPSAQRKPSDAARAKAREAGRDEPPAYNPANFDPGEGYAQGSPSSHLPGRIVLIDEEDGSVMGELSEGFNVVEDSAIKPGSKEPVEIILPADGSQNISVQPAYDYIEDTMHPAYKKSTIVSSATKASRLLITTSDYVAKVMQSQADNFTKATQPAAKPMTFAPTTHDHIRRINHYSNKVATLSAQTIGSINQFAQNFGAGMSKRKDGKARGFDKDGNVIETYKPGVLNKSLMAFNTVVDGMEQAGKTLLSGTTSSMSTVVGHRWGPEAGELSRNLGSGFKNVGLVYIDVTGVSRRAILKSVAKGMVVGKVKGGGQIIVGGDNGSNGAVASGGNGNGEPSTIHNTYGGDINVPGQKDRNGNGNGNGKGNGNGNGKKSTW
ncbi:senescence-associated domain-containing protein [Trichoderma aethiopicum]